MWVGGRQSKEDKYDDDDEEEEKARMSEYETG